MHNLKDKHRVYIEKINRETAYGFKDRGEFDDPRLAGYNYGGLTDFEINFWYNSVTTPRKRYFAVKKTDDNRFIGFMGLKNYNPLTKKAKLGIVFDPNFVSAGYGYEAMSIFLDYYFNELKFREMILEVNLFNERAIKLYKKLGFKECGKKTEVFENQNIKFDERYFEGKRDIIFSKILIMNLAKEDYYEL
ncbi:GNAT family N-acetyltransferase [Anaerococcus sp. DFU013_CI05]|uniref:GNAT family N-acetyltransferase n=1 Tax=Anaerococcus sp. AH8042_DFU013_CI05 TaxID=3385202 RepID=UPI003A52149B